MRTSYDMITSHPKSLIAQTWPTHVPFAVMLALTFYFFLPNKSLHDWGETNPMASFILQTIVYAATILSGLIAFWRLLPLKQLRTEGPVQDEKIGSKWLRILRHLGGFFTTGFLGMMIVGVATCIAALPSIILTIVQLYSQLGALEGDPLGVPTYFTPLLFIVFVATSLLIAYALSWLGLAWAYQYASYQILDEEKKRMNILKQST